MLLHLTTTPLQNALRLCCKVPTNQPTNHACMTVGCCATGQVYAEQHGCARGEPDGTPVWAPGWWPPLQGHSGSNFLQGSIPCTLCRSLTAHHSLRCCILPSGTAESTLHPTRRTSSLLDKAGRDESILLPRQRCWPQHTPPVWILQAPSSWTRGPALATSPPRLSAEAVAVPCCCLRADMRSSWSGLGGLPGLCRQQKVRQHSAMWQHKRRS